MTTLLQFRQKRLDLQARLARMQERHVSPQHLVRRRLERELRAVTAAELKAETAVEMITLVAVPEHPEEEGHELEWYQR